MAAAATVSKSKVEEWPSLFSSLPCVLDCVVLGYFGRNGLYAITCVSKGWKTNRWRVKLLAAIHHGDLRMQGEKRGLGWDPGFLDLLHACNIIPCTIPEIELPVTSSQGKPIQFLRGEPIQLPSDFQLPPARDPTERLGLARFQDSLGRVGLVIGVQKREGAFDTILLVHQKWSGKGYAENWVRGGQEGVETITEIEKAEHLRTEGSSHSCYKCPPWEASNWSLVRHLLSGTHSTFRLFGRAEMTALNFTKPLA